MVTVVGPTSLSAMLGVPRLKRLFSLGVRGYAAVCHNTQHIDFFDFSTLYNVNPSFNIENWPNLL